MAMARGQIEQIIRRTTRLPVERDSVYQPVSEVPQPIRNQDRQLVDKDDLLQRTTDDGRLHDDEWQGLGVHHDDCTRRSGTVRGPKLW